MTESEELQDEILSIDAIYPDSIVKLKDFEYELTIPSHSYLTVGLSFPTEYPANSAPKITCLSSSNSAKFEPDLATINNILKGRFYEGGVCLFDFIEDMREVFPSEEDHEPSIQASDIEETIDNLKDLNLQEGDIFEGWVTSSLISDRKSHFMARVARVYSVQQAQEMCEMLKHDKKIAKAAHNMTAWRIKRDDGITYQDYDDDGETAAGSRLLHLLTVMGLWNVVVFVSRWFGGAHIGPDRFRHISNCAREAIELSDLMDVENSSSKNNVKKTKKLK
ncbi:UPF0029-domain-containing protein [Nadsonia fulvescens var. elongata DSM 6958]|uniref:UPF0029-domain-containing protein n=1 Tax=Nadsonia fulvescens var. elongata DSM 6958 TaxID=857566 RepID=A0A1E3PI73_9ASCO|nr:UPF0029-domain-containing protein [Nadsonia fulvescens var. elongata DSM 6958]